MRQTTKKRLIILIAIVFTLAVMACSVPRLRLTRSARITPTPTRTAKPTFTATTVPTITPIPSDTPTPTLTPTHTPVPTDTPIPSDTPTPTLTPSITPTPPPTETPTITPVPTRRPTARPTKVPTPKPTVPPPPPFTGSIVRGDRNCGGYRGVTGQVMHASGAAFPGIAIGVWSDTWVGNVAQSEASGKYEVSLTGLPDGQFKVAVVKWDTCSQQEGRRTAHKCELRSEILTIVNNLDCNAANASQVTQIDFIGP